MTPDLGSGPTTCLCCGNEISGDEGEMCEECTYEQHRIEWADHYH